MMTANEIRKKFLDFFKSKGHSIIASDSLVPKDDPTVLFTTAGMQQFKRQFLGHIEGYTRATTSQKCLRTDDLDKVGQTAFHHTFFEMLGNFSFGDYFKKEAIHWGWEFLTKEMKLPAAKLWVSVYKEDNEAYDIWFKEIKIPTDRLVRLGDKSNFWPSEAREKGPNGPCGPCSEIFYDYGVNPNCPNGSKCDPDCNCGRFSEVWNLVFTQFNRKDGGVLEPLPAKNIDTGMGLERLVAVVQGKKSNYETDLFMPILEAIDKEIDRGQLHLTPQEKFIMADHSRAMVFAINDGVIPSNKERGSVVKRLINDSTNIPLNKGANGPTIYKLVTVVANIMKVQYPEVCEKATQIANLVQKAEEAFITVRELRIPELKTRVPQLKTSQERGNFYFLCRDTYGLPLSAIISTVQSVGVTSKQIEEDLKIYDQRMAEQKERSRAGSKMAGDVFTGTEVNLNVPKTIFLGYENNSSSAKILKLFIDNQEVSEAKEGDEVKIVLDQTPFYAESGGQTGDSGKLTTTGAVATVSDTQKISDVFIHSATIEKGSFKTGDTVEAAIDVNRRLSIMRNHTATHLLQAALRKILGSHVQQQGSLVAEDRLRFDFTHPQAVGKEQIQAIESIINDEIKAGDAVKTDKMDLKEAKGTGAMAFFAEKYKDVVRVVSVGDYSRELCGGTHVRSTAEIELFKVTSEGAVAQGIRRIEARTASAAQEFIREREKQETQRLQSEAKRGQELEQKKTNDCKILDDFKNSLEPLLTQAQTFNGTKLITQVFNDADMGLLRQLSDLIKQKAGSTVVVLGATYDGNASLLATVSDDLIARGVKANDIITQIAPIINGSGGGRPQMAQAGSKETKNISQAIDRAQQLVKEKLS